MYTLNALQMFRRTRSVVPTSKDITLAMNTGISYLGLVSICVVKAWALSGCLPCHIRISELYWVSASDRRNTGMVMYWQCALCEESLPRTVWEKRWQMFSYLTSGKLWVIFLEGKIWKMREFHRRELRGKSVRKNICIYGLLTVD